MRTPKLKHTKNKTEKPSEANPRRNLAPDPTLWGGGGVGGVPAADGHPYRAIGP